MDKWAVLEEQLKDIEHVKYYELEQSFHALELREFAELTEARFLAMLCNVMDSERIAIWEQTVELIQQLPYQKSYHRKAFRAPNNPMLHNETIVQLLTILAAGYPLRMNDVYTSAEKIVYDGQTACYVDSSGELLAPTMLYTYTLALLLDEEDELSVTFVEDVLWKNGAHSLFDRQLIRAIMMSENETMHALLANVLKAAKNQEGVRQIIVESIDEGSLQAQCYFMKILSTEDFVRFSSVVRAIDVWFGFGYEAKDKKKVQQVLDTALKGLEEGPEALLESDSAQDVYIGIWLLGIDDVEQILARTPKLLMKQPHVQHVTLYALNQLDVAHELGPLLYDYLLESATLQSFAGAYPLVVGHLPYFSRYYRQNYMENLASYKAKHRWLLQRPKDFLEKLTAVEAQLGGASWTSATGPFPFLNVHIEKGTLQRAKTLLLILLEEHAALDELAKEVPKWAVDDRSYFYNAVTGYKPKLAIILQALKDRSSATREDALNMLDDHAFPLAEFADATETLLKQKSGTMRQAVIKLLIKQPIEELKTYASQWLTHKHELVRLGALELLVELKDDIRVADFVAQLPEPTEKEQQLLALLVEETIEEHELAPIAYPFEFERSIPCTLEQFATYDFKKMRQKFQPLQQLIEQYADETYEEKTYQDTTEHRLIGEYLTSEVNEDFDETSIDSLPFAKAWTDGLINSQLTSLDIYMYHALHTMVRTHYYFANQELERDFSAAFLQQVDLQATYDQLCDGLYKQQLHTLLHYTIQHGSGPLQQQLTEHFAHDYHFVTFANGLIIDYAQQAKGSDFIAQHYEGDVAIARNVRLISGLIEVVDRNIENSHELAQMIYRNGQFNQAPEAAFAAVSVSNFLFAYDLNMIDDYHLRYFIQHSYEQLLNLEESSEKLDSYKKAAALRACIKQMNEDVIAGELARGELVGPYTNLVQRIGKIAGSHHFIAILQALGNEKLSRNYVYSATVRKDSLSKLLAKTCPDLEEDKDSVFEALKKADVTVQRLIEVMLYNTAWLPLLSEFIGWKGLANVAWYFVAHTAEYANKFEKAHIEEYSAIESTAFEEGAFDREWFLNAYAEIGAERFDMVYNAAKYSASGSNHRRAQLYAKASLGKIDEKSLREEIDAKRNKDKLRAYSLLPIARSQATERYMYFQQFAKDSKQFGAQRRESETIAANMAITNLALQVGGGNVKQFMWEMELSQWLTHIQPFFEPVAVEDVTLQLVHEQEKIVLHVVKNDKMLKNVPAKLKKHPVVQQIQQAKKEATEQYRRARQQLEEAMCEEVAFDSQVVKKLLQHTLLKELLTQVVWKQREQFCYLEDEFYALNQEKLSLQGDIIIAHPAHFYAAKNWRAWQHFIFEQQWQQPFKQLFREFYIATADEVAQATTNRFEGYQIQPNKAVALLRSRGWQIGYYEPIRHISYHYNVVTMLGFEYDAYTPADVEAPTIGTLYFDERMTGKPKRIQSLSPVFFSEIMRDVDLVASVAHVGEVDPDASHSTIEMRTVIAEEVALLFGFDHIQVKAPHVLIRGTLGNYSLHLGSGHVHQQGGTMIPVATIPSQHRGRVFLPFIDEDPKTAEIMAKLLLFAQDDQINDPAIRTYIMR